MKRIVEQELHKWRSSKQRQPILLRGARQVGKTHAVRKLGQKFDSFVEINLEKNPELIKIFEYNLDPFRISRELSLALQQPITPGETLLFIDEIQEHPRAIIALRYFYEEMPELHVIAAGSLVDFAIEQVGVPVGRIQFLYLYPVSFIEYLCAKGANLLAREIIQHEPSVPINEAIHQKALRLLGEYIAIGGMPKALTSLIENQDIDASDEALKSIKISYEQDFSKYAKKHQIKYVELLFKKVPELICKPFNYVMLESAYRKRELEPALYLLEKAGLVYFVRHSRGNGIPIGAELGSDKFKLITLDIGLNQSILDHDLKDWFIEPEVALINKGGITESYVGQELLAYSSSLDKADLHYWQRESRGSTAEVDYLISHDRKVIPVEVKSGKGSTLYSMHLFLKSHKNSPYGIRFSIHNYSVFDNIHSYPLYAVAAITQDKQALLDFVV